MSATAFGALKLAGAAYLAALGVQALLSARRGELLSSEGAGMLMPAAMVVTMAGLAFAVLAGFALLAGRLRTALARPRVSRAVNGTVGGVLVALAAKLAGAAH